MGSSIKEARAGEETLINTTPALRATPPRLRRVFGSSSDSTCKAFHAGDHHSCLDQFVQPPKLEKGVLPNTMTVNVIVDYANNENTTR